MSQYTVTNIMESGRKELHFGGEAQRKEEAGYQNGKQLGRTRKTQEEGAQQRK